MKIDKMDEKRLDKRLLNKKENSRSDAEEKKNTEIKKVK